jgi:uncharacterized LabA/DUF88 family protein
MSQPPRMSRKGASMKKKNKALVVLDIDNLNGPEIGLKLNLDRFAEFVSSKFSDYDCHFMFYKKFPTMSQASQFLENYKNKACIKYIVRSFTKGDPDLDVCIALDTYVEAPNFDLVVFGSGDADFVPLLDRLESLGIPVEIIANKKSFALILSKHVRGVTFIPRELFDEVQQDTKYESKEDKQDEA